jgi:hypothetical protein
MMTLFGFRGDIRSNRRFDRGAHDEWAHGSTATLATVQRALRDMISSRPDDACAPLPQRGMV